MANDVLAGQGNFVGWLMSTTSLLILGINNNSTLVYGEENWLVPGTYTWTVPNTVTSVDVLCIGGGGGGTSTTGGFGGHLSYKTMSVTPGTTYNVYVGGGGTPNNSGGDSYILDQSTTQIITGISTVSTSGSQYFTTTGSNSFTIPELVTSITGYAIGAGGGTVSRASYYGGFPGAGATVYGTFTNLTPGTNMSINVGAVGTTGTNPTAGGSTTISAGGGTLIASGGSAPASNTAYAGSRSGSPSNAASFSGDGLNGANIDWSSTPTGLLPNYMNKAAGGAGGGTGSGSGSVTGVVGYKGGTGGNRFTYDNALSGWPGSTTSTPTVAGTGIGTALPGQSTPLYGITQGAAFITWSVGSGSATVITLTDASMLSIGMLIQFTQSIGNISATTPYYICYKNGNKIGITTSNVVSASPGNFNTTASNVSVTILYSTIRASGGGSTTFSFPSTGENPQTGGEGNTSGGGGAGGYAGTGGAGGASGSGGGAAGGTGNQGGGGVGIYGQTTDGTTGVNNGGSGGFASEQGTTTVGAKGGFFGGGGGIGTTGGNGGNGAVRIIWGSNRSFPNTNTSVNNTSIGTGSLIFQSSLIGSPAIVSKTQVSSATSTAVTMGNNAAATGKASFSVGGNAITGSATITIPQELFVTNSPNMALRTTPYIFSKTDISVEKEQYNETFTNAVTGTRAQISNPKLSQTVINEVSLASKNSIPSTPRPNIFNNTRIDINNVDQSIEKNINTTARADNITLVNSDQNLSTNIQDRIGWGSG